MFLPSDICKTETWRRPFISSESRPFLPLITASDKTSQKHTVRRAADVQQLARFKRVLFRRKSQIILKSSFCSKHNYLSKLAALQLTDSQKSLSCVYRHISSTFLAVFFFNVFLTIFQFSALLKRWRAAGPHGTDVSIKLAVISYGDELVADVSLGLICVVSDVLLRLQCLFPNPPVWSNHTQHSDPEAARRFTFIVLYVSVL